MVSKSTIDTILNRIKLATISSPIAVFRLPASESQGKYLNAVFGRTIQTQRELESPDFVGMYNRCHSKKSIEAKLKAALAASNEKN